jgi:hypothetical protein
VRICDLKSDLRGDLILDVQNVAGGQIPVIRVAPDVAAGMGIQQLGADADWVRLSPDAALDHVVGAELLGEDGDIDRLALVLERGVAGVDQKFLVMRELCDELLRDPVGEIFLIRVAREVVEWEHGNWWAARQSQDVVRDGARPRSAYRLPKSAWW